MNALMKLVLICGLIVGLAIPALAADERSEKKSEKSEKSEKSKEKFVPKTAFKEISGEVAGISKDFIAVMYKEDVAAGIENEMGLNIEGTPELQKVQDISQIEVGAMVTVQYDEITGKDDQDREVTKRLARKITLTKPAPPPPPPEPEPVE